jgi:hypothetical protein
MKILLTVIVLVILGTLMFAAFMAAEAYINSDEYEGKDE